MFTLLLDFLDKLKSWASIYTISSSIHFISLLNAIFSSEKTFLKQVFYIDVYFD